MENWTPSIAPQQPPQILLRVPVAWHGELAAIQLPAPEGFQRKHTQPLGPGPGSDYVVHLELFAGPPQLQYTVDDRISPTQRVKVRAVAPAQDKVTLIPRRDLGMPLPDVRHDGARKHPETVPDEAVEQPELPHPRPAKQGRAPPVAEPDRAPLAAEQASPGAQPEAEVHPAAFGAEDVLGAGDGRGHDDPPPVPCVGAAWSARAGAPFFQSHLGHAVPTAGAAVLAAVVQKVSMAHF
jgi:hypothetical protein